MTAARTLPPLVAILLAAALPGCWAKPEATYLARYTVHSGDLDIDITAEGALKSVHPTRIVSAGTGKIIFIITQGSHVTKGQKLVELENADLKNSLRYAQEGLIADHRDQLTAELQIKIVKLDGEKALQDTRTALNNAQLAFDAYVKGKAPLQEQDLKLAVEKAEGDLTDAKEKAARMPMLLQKGFVTKSESRQAELDLKEKTLAVDHKKRELEIYLQYDYPSDKSKVENELLSQQQALTRVADKNATELAQKQSDYDKAITHIHEDERKAEELQKQVDGLVMTAPNDGMVVYGDADREMWEVQTTRGYQIGADVNLNETVLSIPNFSTMQAMVNVNEIDVTRIALGMHSVTEIKGMSGKRFEGEVIEVASTAAQNWMGDVKQYQTRVSMKGLEGLSFRPDMSAKSVIHVATLTHVLHVPIEAVYSHGDAHYCWVRAPDGALALHVVVLGKSNDSRVEVRSGLADGDEVVVPEQEPDIPSGAFAAAGSKEPEHDIH